MPRAKKSAEVVEESIRLSSGVTIIVRATAAVYDTLDISRIGGVVTVALPGAQLQRNVHFGSGIATASLGYVESGVADTPVDPEAIEAARAALTARHPKGPVPNADDLAAAAGYDTSAIQRSIAAATQTPFIGISNEDTDA